MAQPHGCLRPPWHRAIVLAAAAIPTTLAPVGELSLRASTAFAAAPAAVPLDVPSFAGARQAPTAVGEGRPRRVVGWSRRVVNASTWVTTASETIESTPDHRYFVTGRGWLAAEKLAVGDPLDAQTPLGHIAVAATFTGPSAPHAVYNLQVEEYPTYRVGRAKALVHNGQCFATPSPPLSQVVLSAHGQMPRELPAFVRARLPENLRHEPLEFVVPHDVTVVLYAAPGAQLSNDAGKLIEKRVQAQSGRRASGTVADIEGALVYRERYIDTEGREMVMREPSRTAPRATTYAEGARAPNLRFVPGAKADGFDSQLRYVTRGETRHSAPLTGPTSLRAVVAEVTGKTKGPWVLHIAACAEGCGLPHSNLLLDSQKPKRAGP